LVLALPGAKAAPTTAGQGKVLPDKYTPIFWEHLKGFERARCQRYVDELMRMEQRKRLGVRPWELDKMQARATKIDKDYDRYCLKLTDKPA
jgi:hypothetical protein